MSSKRILRPNARKERTRNIFSALPGESKIEQCQRLYGLGFGRRDICKRTSRTAADLDAAGIPKSKTGRKGDSPEETEEVVLPPPLSAGRKCWLDTAGIVTLDRRQGDGKWWVVNKHGEHIEATESELVPLGLNYRQEVVPA